MWWEEFGREGTLSRCKAGNRRAGTTLRLTRAGSWQQEQLDWLAKLHTESKPARWFGEYRYLSESPDVAPLFESHGEDLVVQNESAAAAVYLLELKEGETLIDVGAAPGGKTSHALKFLGPAGKLLGLDNNPRRMRRLVENLRRVGSGHTLLVRADGRHLPVRSAGKILLDAPCTGLGLLHRHPELRWQKRAEDLPRLAALQAELLEACVQALSPGGRLVYSTCSTARAENEDQIGNLLKWHPELTAVDPRPLLPEGVPGGPQWVKIDPDPPRLDGAFACALAKLGSEVN
jgi:16S rRNA (cytosine967-C5)-methyltransferase